MKACKTNSRKQRGFGVESLENRQLMAADLFASLAEDVAIVEQPTVGLTAETGVLTVSGTEQGDRVVVDYANEDHQTVRVTVGEGATQTVHEFDRGDVFDIVFTGMGGDDQFVNATDIELNADGGEGNDLIRGGSNDDVLFGGGGDDRLAGGHGDDVLLGGAGNDVLAGREGDDELYGSDGDDRLVGGAGDDLLHGEEGQDDLVDSTHDVLVGGNGQDRVNGQPDDEVSVLPLPDSDGESDPVTPPTDGTTSEPGGGGQDQGSAVNFQTDVAFMKLGDIPGEATDQGHKKWVLIESMSSPLYRSIPEGAKVQQRTKGDTTLGEMVIVRPLDRSSTKIQEASANGTYIKEVEIHFCTPIDGKNVPYLKYKLENVIVTSYQLENAIGSPLPSERLTLSYTKAEWTYIVVDPETGDIRGNVPGKYEPGAGKG